MRKRFFFKNSNAKDVDSSASLEELMTLPPTTVEQHRRILGARVLRRRAIEDAQAVRSLLADI
jgi:hypothetical protein